MYAFTVSFVLVYSTNTVCQVTFLILKIEKLVVGAFLVSGVWHVVWWSLITSVRLIQKFGFINGVDNVNWPPYRDSKILDSLTDSL